MAAFEYRQAEEIRDAFARHGVRYLFIGKSGAILLGYSDTTQDADVFVEKSPANGNAIVAALRELGFQLTEAESAEIERGKDFVQLKNGRLTWTWSSLRWHRALRRRVAATRRGEGFMVCSIDDILASKKAANRPKIVNRSRGLRHFANISPQDLILSINANCSQFGKVSAQSRRCAYCALAA